MYETYWRLARKPFEHSVDPKFYYPSEAHQAALLKLRYAVENCRGAAVLFGPGGAGKTLLAQSLRRHLPEECHPLVHLVFPQMPSDELLAYLADEIGAPAAADARHTIEQSVRRIQRFLADNTQKGRHAVVIVDEAHLLENLRALEALRLLLNFEVQGRPQLTLLLVGQTPLLSLLDRMPQFEERLAARCLLPALSVDDTISYVHHRLTAAGAERPIFETDALETLHEATQGLPRRINRLADLALLVGYAEELTSIGPAQIEAVSQELAMAAA